jgi:hypothetical protein
MTTNPFTSIQANSKEATEIQLFHVGQKGKPTKMSNPEKPNQQPESLALAAMEPADLTRQIALIQEVMSAVMRPGEHYGVIPGTGKKVTRLNKESGRAETVEEGKPTLLKPGAEKLGFLFRLAPRYQITMREFAKGHREYEVLCSLEQIQSGRFFGAGVGSATTMESKYRFRSDVIKGAEGKPRLVPKTYWDDRDPAKLGGPQFSPRKIDGQWVIVQRVEHDNPADYYNTVLKMAKKRAHVDAVLTATAASDIFTQDLEDLELSVESAPPAPPQPEHKENDWVRKFVAIYGKTYGVTDFCIWSQMLGPDQPLETISPKHAQAIMQHRERFNQKLAEFLAQHDPAVTE